MNHSNVGIAGVGFPWYGYSMTPTFDLEPLQPPSPESLGLTPMNAYDTYPDGSNDDIAWIGSKWDIVEHRSRPGFSIYRKGNYYAHANSFGLALLIVGGCD